MSRTQINFRLDTELLAAIKAKCDASDINLTQFLTDAARSALGFQTMNPTTALNSEVLSGIVERIAIVEKRLDSRLADRDEVEQLQQQLVETLGESRA